MSDVVGNPEDRFSRVEAQIENCFCQTSQERCRIVFIREILKMSCKKNDIEFNDITTPHLQKCE